MVSKSSWSTLTPLQRYVRSGMILYNQDFTFTYGVLAHPYSWSSPLMVTPLQPTLSCRLTRLFSDGAGVGELSCFLKNVVDKMVDTGWIAKKRHRPVFQSHSVDSGATIRSWPAWPLDWVSVSHKWVLWRGSPYLSDSWVVIGVNPDANWTVTEDRPSRFIWKKNSRKLFEVLGLRLSWPFLARRRLLVSPEFGGRYWCCCCWHGAIGWYTGRNRMTGRCRSSLLRI